MSEQEKKPGRRLAQKDGLWTRYKTWLSGLSRGQKIRYRILQIATIIALLIIIGFVALEMWIRMPTLGNLPNQGEISLEESELPAIAQSGRKPGVFTFLVAGKDVVSGGTDTMLLITYDTKEKKIYGVNLPRDTMINTTATSKRLNAVYTRNRGSKDLPEKERVELGMQALKKEVAKITGIMPDFYVLVEWEAIGELVDAIGGVYFEVPFLMEYNDAMQDLHIYQEPGYRLLKGTDAMQVIRFRKNDDRTISLGDVGRLKIQQDFLKVVAKKCLQPATLLKLPELSKIFMENVTTDLTTSNILALAQRAIGMDTENNVSFQTLPLAASFLYKSAALVTLDADKILEIVNDGMNPYLRDIEKSDLELVYRKSNGTFTVIGGQSAISQSSSSSGSSTKPSSGTTTKPSGSTSSSTKPSTTKPSTTKPSTTKPSTTKPDTTVTNPDKSQGTDSTQKPDQSTGTTKPETTQKPDQSTGSSTPSQTEKPPAAEQPASTGEGESSPASLVPEVEPADPVAENAA